MNGRIFLTFICLALALVAPFPATADGSHDHDGHTAGAEKLTLNKGAKWQTDKVLRDGMLAIRDDLGAVLPEIHKSSMAVDRYVVLADRVQGHLDRMTATCRLPPDADTQLHVVLAQVYEGVDAMKKGPDRKAGALAVMQALEDYSRYFVHPGWTPLDH